MSTRGPGREGKVHVHAERCRTCIFRPGNLMDLPQGGVAGMVQDARADSTVIICHETLDGFKAVCAGYATLRPQPDILQVAERLGLIALVEPDPQWGQ